MHPHPHSIRRKTPSLIRTARKASILRLAAGVFLLAFPWGVAASSNPDLDGVASRQTSEGWFTNPSFLSVSSFSTLSASGSKSPDGQNRASLLAQVPKKFLGFAAGFSRTSVADIPLRGDLNQNRGSAAFFEHHGSLGIGFGGARPFSAGCALHYKDSFLGEDLRESRLYAAAGFVRPYKSVSWGFVLNDIGLKGGPEIRLGMARSGYFFAELDCVFPKRESAYPLLYAGWRPFSHWTLRLSYSGGADGNRSDPWQALRWGMDWQFRSLILGYACVPRGNAGWQHHWSVTYKGRIRQ